MLELLLLIAAAVAADIAAAPPAGTASYGDNVVADDLLQSSPLSLKGSAKRLGWKLLKNLTRRPCCWDGLPC